MIHVIKAVLIVLSGYSYYQQYKAHNSFLKLYWFTVGLYWTVNLMQGLIK